MIDIKGLFIIVFAVFATYYRHQYKKTLTESRKTIQSLNLKVSTLDVLYNSIQQHYMNEIQKRTNETCELNSLKAVTTKCKEAVKFAMICSHPDEPRGNEKRFMEYKLLYDYIKEI